MRLVVEVEDAGAQLEALIERALAGDEVVIADAGRPVARLVPYDDDASA